MSSPAAPCSQRDVLATPDPFRPIPAGGENGRSTHGQIGTVTVVIPTKNEARNLPWTMRRIPDWVDQVVVVDGRSTDDTVAVARALRPDVTVVMERRPGKGAAIRAGFEAATGDCVVMIDADGSMDPYEIGRYVNAIADGADLAKGSRRMPGGGSADITFIRDLGNRGLLLAANLLFRSRFSELCYGFMAVRRSSIEALELCSDGFEIETEIVARAVHEGMRVVEVPSYEYPRRHGESNLSAIRDGLRIVRTLLQVRTGIGRPRVPSIPAPQVRHPQEVVETRRAA